MTITTQQDKEFWTLPELSREIGKHRATILGWIKTGKLKSRRLGTQYRIYRSDWQQFVASCNGGEVVEL